METTREDRTDAIRARVRAHLETRGLTLAEAARSIGMSGAAISSWLGAKYRGDNDRVADLVERWLETEQVLAEVRIIDLSRYAELGVSMAVHALAAHAQANADIALLYGAAGSGKTRALTRFCAEHSGAFYVEMSPDITTVARVLDRIAEGLGFAHLPDRGPRLVRLLVEHLRGRDALLVIDEAHHLTEALLDMVRCLYDRAGCGLVLAGNDPLWSRLAGGERAAQLVSRIGVRRRFGRPKATDALLLAETLIQRAPEGKGRKAVLDAARGLGGLRAVAKLVALAGAFARRDESAAVRDEDLVKAAAHMSGV